GGGDHVAGPQAGAAVARQFFRELGTTQDRIRDVPAAEILAAQKAIAIGPRGSWIWRPTIDGAALTELPLTTIAAGAGAAIPLLAQSCAREAALYQLLDRDAGAQADRVLAGYFGAPARDRIFEAYAKSRPELAADPTALRVAVMTDERYGIPTTRLADAHSAHAPVWRSRYDGPLTGLPDPVPAHLEFLVPLLGAAHGSDGSGVWQGGSGLAGLLHAAWGAFACGASPGSASPDSASPDSASSGSASPDWAGLPSWPAYDTTRRPTMIFHPDGPYLAADPNSAERAAWDGLTWVSGTWWEVDGMD
ncbi:MAG: carboxylesterase family protein, partial [Streptosporangiaceae bacterium]